MNAAFKNDLNPVRRFLNEHVPAYVDWFPAWREQRNRVKDGVSFSIAGPEEDLGIRVDEFTAQGGISVDLTRAVRLGDVVAAVDASAWPRRWPRSAPRRRAETKPTRQAAWAIAHPSNARRCSPEAFPRAHRVHGPQRARSRLAPTLSRDKAVPSRNRP